MRRNRPQRAILSIVVLLVAVAVVLWLAAGNRGPATPASPSSQLLVAALDVGQADSIFVRSASGRTMLIDSGNAASDSEKVILPFLKKQGVSSLDYLVLTHPDQDHVGGMPAVLDGIAVATFVDSVQPGQTNQSYRRVLERVQEKGMKALKARRGGTGIDMGAGTTTQVLGPEEPLITADSPTNNNSVVLRLTFGKVSILLTGDVGQDGEERLLGHRDDLRAQILKVAHHGSQSSSTKAFLDAVRPEVALISVGEGNSYGHPSKATLQRLEQHSARIYRTDANGTIQVTSDGTTYSVATEKSGG